MKRFSSLLTLSMFIWIIMGFIISGHSFAGGVPPCAGSGSLEKSISSEAVLTDFSCDYKMYEGAEVLHFHVALKNVSDKPQRFRVHIFLDNGKAVGGLIPNNTTGGLVEPGQTASFEYPVTGMIGLPGEIVLNISTMTP